MYRKYKEPDFMPTRPEMLRVIQEAVKPVRQTEEVDAADSLGRVCAADAVSRNTLPNTRTTRLDGIGVRFADFAGDAPDTTQWKEGEEFYFANTGAALAEGFDTVVLVEEIDFEDGVLTVHTPPKERGEYIGERGGSMKAGEILVAAGTRVAPVHLGLLASGGVTRVSVLKKPVIAILPSGNELVEAGKPLPAGKNVESNSHTLSGCLRLWGAQPVVFPIIEDSLDALVAALGKALREADAVILMAGSSKGTMDFSMEALAATGEILVHELAHGPGRHSSLTLAGEKPIFGVAGPMMGAWLVSELYVRPFVDRLLGQPARRHERMEVVLDHAFAVHDVDFCELIHVYEKDGALRGCSAMDKQKTWPENSAAANAFLYRAAGSGYSAGDRAPVELTVSSELIFGAP